jgi:tRNA pseudouridine38-40 synthase
MYAATCRREGDLIVIELEANGFMRQMVRSIVGTLILVGRGKHSPEEVGAILAAKDRRLAGPTVPAHGLYLIQVRYAGESHLHEPMYPARPALTYSALGDHEEQA